MASNKLEGSTFSTSSKSKTSSSKPMNPPSSAMLTQLRIPSNISFFRDLIDKRIVLDERHVKALETTPFHNFLKIPASLSNEQIAIDCLIQNFNSDKCSFLIGNKECAFGIDDIHRITGLRKEGMPIKMNGTAANTIYTQIVKTYKTLKEKMGSSKGKKKVDEEKKTVIWGKRDRMAEMIVDMTTKDPIICVKLIVAFIIGFILCPRTCKTCPLWAFRYADQLSTLKKYNWCHAVFTFLSKEMIKAKKSLSMRGLGQRLNAGYMGGFSSVLLVWFYEKVGELEYTSDIERLPPFFCVKNTGKWRRTTMNKLYRDPKFLTDRTSPEGFESRRDELIAIIAKKTSELNELTIELRELEERRARCMEKNEEKEDNRNVNEENKSNRDKEANEYENVKENEEADFDDDFMMSPRDKKIVEAVRDVSQKEEGGIDQKKETSSIKWAVRKRKRKDGPSVTSSYLRLDQPKEGTKKKHVIQTLDSPEGATKKKCKNEEGCMPTSCNYPEARYKFLSALEGDKQQLQQFYNACRGLSQQNSYVPVAPPDARPTPNPSHIHSNVSAAPAPSHSPVPEDVQLAMAINASIQSALAEGVPVPNPQPVNLSTNTNGWAPSENTTTTTYNGWGQSSGAPPPSKVATTSDPFNGWSGVRPSSSSPHLHNSQLETPSVLPSVHEAPPTVTVPSAPPTVTVPSAPPLAEETFYPGPVQYPTIDSSLVDLSVPAAGSKAEPFDPKEDSSGGESSSCVICLDAPVEGACIPCGHMAGCMSCLNEIKGKKWGCPVCCANIDQVIRLYAV